MKIAKRILVGLTLYCSCTAVVLLGVAFGTKNWIQSDAVRVAATITNLKDVNNGTERFKGQIHFGLFEGVKDLNHGWGDRKKRIWIVCLPSDNVCIWSRNATAEKRIDEINELVQNLTSTNPTVKGEYDKDPSFIDFHLWVATIIFLSLAILFGVVGAGFSILNVVSTPIECITGVRGLYVWNAISTVFTMVCIAMWTALYYKKFKTNVMSHDEIQSGWSSEDRASFGYSFWIVIGAMLFYVVNLVIVFVASIEPAYQRRTKAVVNEKPADGIIMLF